MRRSFPALNEPGGCDGQAKANTPRHPLPMRYYVTARINCPLGQGKSPVLRLHPLPSPPTVAPVREWRQDGLHLRCVLLTERPENGSPWMPVYCRDDSRFLGGRCRSDIDFYLGETANEN